ncbi:MAG: zinc ribbon domain-containing protein [Promethearchaeota archaeon]
MTEAKDYIWLLPFIGAILVAIGLLTPAAYDTSGTTSQFIWMTGFMVVHGVMYDDSGLFAKPLGGDVIFGYVIPGIIATIFLTICTIILFISALTHRGKETPGSWIALGILLIGGAIYFIAGVEIGVASYFYSEGATEHVSFWTDLDYNAGFAVIAPFIGGGLSLLGAIIGKAMGRQVGVVKPAAIPKVEKPTPVAPTPPSPPVGEPKDFRYCPECGAKIMYKESRFCSSCGYEIPE